MLTLIFKTIHNTPFAIGYTRVVIGGQGSYIEFEEDQICAELICKPDQKYRYSEKYKYCKYYWLIPKGESDIKVYHQKNTVAYADYKIGKYYVDPNLLEWDSSSLYAEKGEAQGVCNPCEYKKMKKINKKEKQLKITKRHGLKCEDCGKRSAEVEHTTCPYAEEINDEIIDVDLCPNCYHERCMDI